MTTEKLKQVLDSHLLWLQNNENGQRADLSKADLSGADLREAKNIYIFNKKNGRTCYAVAHATTLMVKAGCFWGTLIEFETACMEKYGNDKSKNYAIQRTYLNALSKSIYETEKP